jgi:hypothetical protein
MTKLEIIIREIKNYKSEMKEVSRIAVYNFMNKPVTIADYLNLAEAIKDYIDNK